ncbi:MAG: DUF354 domain-containing protein [Candidatus Bathyarchaeia archaeon]
MKVSYDIWVDISNTPQIHLMNSILKELQSDYKVFITGFKRGEVVELAKLYGLHGKFFGTDKTTSIGRGFSFASRSILLVFSVPKARVLLSFENAMPIITSRLRGMRSILMLDNDLKFRIRSSFFQTIENKIKALANYVIVPEIVGEFFATIFGEEKVLTYPGLKEHIYIADYKPDPSFPKLIPFKEYVVVRPESVGTFYVEDKKSIVPELLRELERENIHVVYLPRNARERELAKGCKNIYIPSRALSGLDLIYYSKAVLTGSGTMAREAALLGVPAASFFPGKTLLLVDKYLASIKAMFYSRDARELVNYILSVSRQKAEYDIARKVKASVTKMLRELLK